MTAKRVHVSVLDAELKRAMEPYKELLPRHIQGAFRELLVRALTEDPTGKALLDRVRPAPLMTKSGEALKEGAEEPASQEAASSGQPSSRRGGDKQGGRQ